MTDDVETSVRRWGMLCHLSALLVLTGLPVAHLLGPLAVWLFKRNDFPFVNAQGKEALNFQMSMTLYAVAAAFLSIILIGIPLLMAIFIGDLVLTVIASIKASDGISYRYPLTLRFLK